MPRFTGVALAHQAFPSVAHALLPAVVNEYRLLRLWGQRAQPSGWEFTPGPVGSGGQGGDIFHQGGVKLKHSMALGFHSFIHSLAFIAHLFIPKYLLHACCYRINSVTE